eukprot:4708607-Pyramimonas_sp.AAC.1
MKRELGRRVYPNIVDDSWFYTGPPFPPPLPSLPHLLLLRFPLFPVFSVAFLTRKWEGGGHYKGRTDSSLCPY